ncbi:FAD-dependent oxidoreductase [Leucobacter massiliensis]|uniref:FAD-dependent oxidoreductase n=1 Tax=Leucobacter massiliensis TaxID=1686285 RepID=A0A2S9QKF3_9MICO|nr:FAD-dependent oxidoreductase [Leucobacter massiliensis]PRI10021.1 FAD-dependent oxidoreductase [Leucobacter massiliensis]PRI10066.1 FAD-dependent oxidoreductase [Leucobacter massiliensis]
MRSLWQLTAPPIPSDPFGGPGTDAGSERPADAVVVGAGLTGLVTAVLLARAGQAVTVLEARSVGAVATGNTTAKLSLLQGTVMSDIRRLAGDEVLHAYVEGNREGQAWLLRELEGHEGAVEFRTAYTYASAPEQLASLESELDAAASAGLAARETGETGLPFEVHGALALDEQAQLQPMRVLSILAAELRERGGRLVEGCEVHDVEQREGGVRVVSGFGTIDAVACVLATGTPILDRGLFFAKLKPSRSFVTAYHLPEASPPRGMYVAAGTPMHSLRSAPDADGGEALVVGGGGRTPGTFGDTREELRELDAWTAGHFPSARRLTWWAAQDYQTHARVPFAGAMPRGGGRIFAATGYDKWGMTNGVAAALAITSELLGGRKDWAELLNDHGHSLAEAAQAVAANAEVAGRMVSGWAGAEARSVAGAEDLADGEGFVGRDGVAPVGVSRVDGRLCKVSAVCPHMGGILAWNAAERSWDCPLHGSRFAADGARLEGPALRGLAPAGE